MKERKPFQYFHWLQAKQQLIMAIKHRDQPIEKIVDDFFRRYFFELGQQHCVTMEAQRQDPEGLKFWLRDKCIREIVNRILEEGLYSLEEDWEQHHLVKYRYRVLVFGAPDLVAASEPPRV